MWLVEIPTDTHDTRPAYRGGWNDRLPQSQRKYV
jgi:hypothetical protein